MLDTINDDSCAEVDDLQPMAWHDEVLKLRTLVKVDELDSNAHFATAVLTKVLVKNTPLAYQEIETAIEKSTTKSRTFTYLVYLGRLHYWKGQDFDNGRSYKNALRYFDLAFNLRDAVSTDEILYGLHTKAMILKQEAMWSEVLPIFEEIRSLDSDGVFADSLLVDEFNSQDERGDYPGLIKYYLGLKPFDRLNLVLNRYFWHDCHYKSLPMVLLAAAITTGQVKELVQTYASIVASLNANKMGPVWAPWLAHVHWTLEGDIEAAKDLLNKALDIPYTSQEYPLVEMDSGTIVMCNVNMLSDILFEQFQSSKDPESKLVVLEEQAGALLQRNLPQSVQINDAGTMPHLLVVANMTRKVGRPQDYERIMRQIFDISWTNLHDSITWNDGVNLRNLSRIVAQIPDLRRDAEILNSSQLYHLGDRSFFAWYCRRNGVKISDDLGIKIECATTDESRRRLIDEAENLSTSCDVLLQKWRLYKEEDPGGYSLDSLPDRPGSIETSGSRDDSLAHCTAILYCSGKARVSWDNDPLYTCLTCTDSRLCQQCYNLRMKWNKQGKPDGQPSFCCRNGQYLKSPAPNWLGIKHQTIYLKGESPIKVDDFLEQMRARWNHYWEGFWLG